MMWASLKFPVVKWFSSCKHLCDVRFSFCPQRYFFFGPLGQVSGLTNATWVDFKCHAVIPHCSSRLPVWLMWESDHFQTGFKFNLCLCRWNLPPKCHHVMMSQLHSDGGSLQGHDWLFCESLQPMVCFICPQTCCWTVFFFQLGSLEGLLWCAFGYCMGYKTNDSRWVINGSIRMDDVSSLNI